jgi:hypothetical protein
MPNKVTYIDPSTGLTEEVDLDLAKQYKYETRPIVQIEKGLSTQDVEAVPLIGTDRSIYDNTLEYSDVISDPNAVAANRHEQQGAFATIGAGLAQGVTTAAGQLLQDVGFMLDFESIGNMITGSEKEFGNWLTQAGDKIIEAGSEFAPVYQDPDKQGGFNPGDLSWWMGSVAPSVIGSAALLIPGLGIAKGLQFAGKGLRLGANASRLFGGVVGGIANRYGESMMEAGGVMKEFEQLANSPLTFEQAKQIERQYGIKPDQYYNQETGAMYYAISPEVAKEAGARAAMNNFKANQALATIDIAQVMFATTPFGSVTKKLTRDMAKTLGKSGLAAIGKTATGALVNNLGEGVEEAYQYMSAERSKELELANMGLIDKEDLSDSVKKYLNDGELWTSAVGGFLGGSLMTGAGKLMENIGRRPGEITEADARLANISSSLGQMKASTLAMAKAENANTPQGRTEYERIRANNITSMAVEAGMNGNLGHLIEAAENARDDKDVSKQLLGIENEEEYSDFKKNADNLISTLKTVESVMQSNINKEGDMNLAKAQTLADVRVSTYTNLARQSQKELDELTNSKDSWSLSPLSTKEPHANFKARKLLNLEVSTWTDKREQLVKEKAARMVKNSGKEDFITMKNDRDIALIDKKLEILSAKRESLRENYSDADFKDDSTNMPVQEKAKDSFVHGMKNKVDSEYELMSNQDDADFYRTKDGKARFKAENYKTKVKQVKRAVENVETAEDLQEIIANDETKTAEKTAKEAVTKQATEAPEVIVETPIESTQATKEEAASLFGSAVSEVPQVEAPVQEEVIQPVEQSEHPLITASNQVLDILANNNALRIAFEGKHKDMLDMVPAMQEVVAEGMENPNFFDAVDDLKAFVETYNAEKRALEDKKVAPATTVTTVVAEAAIAASEPLDNTTPHLHTDKSRKVIKFGSNRLNVFSNTWGNKKATGEDAGLDSHINWDFLRKFSLNYNNTTDKGKGKILVVKDDSKTITYDNGTTVTPYYFAFKNAKGLQLLGIVPTESMTTSPEEKAFIKNLRASLDKEFAGGKGVQISKTKLSIHGYSADYNETKSTKNFADPVKLKGYKRPGDTSARTTEVDAAGGFVVGIVDSSVDVNKITFNNTSDQPTDVNNTVNNGSVNDRVKLSLNDLSKQVKGDGEKLYVKLYNPFVESAMRFQAGKNASDKSSDGVATQEAIEAEYQLLLEAKVAEVVEFEREQEPIARKRIEDFYTASKSGSIYVGVHHPMVDGDILIVQAYYANNNQLEGAAKDAVYDRVDMEKDNAESGQALLSRLEKLFIFSKNDHDVLRDRLIGLSGAKNKDGNSQLSSFFKNTDSAELFDRVIGNAHINLDKNDFNKPAGKYGGDTSTVTALGLDTSLPFNQAVAPFIQLGLNQDVPFKNVQILVDATIPLPEIVVKQKKFGNAKQQDTTGATVEDIKEVATKLNENSGIIPGEIIYATPGSGKTTLVNDKTLNPNGKYVDGDTLMLAEMQKFGKTSLSQYGELTKDQKNTVINKVRSIAKDMVKAGKTVLTGNFALIPLADKAFINSNRDSIKDRMTKSGKTFTDEGLNSIVEREKELKAAKTDLGGEFISEALGLSKPAEQVVETVEQSKATQESPKVEPQTDSVQAIPNRRVKGKPKLSQSTETVVSENSEDEIKWFKKYFPHIPISELEEIKDMVRNVTKQGHTAWGAFTNASIYLRDKFPEGTVYHEAFHVVFNLALSEKEKATLLAQAEGDALIDKEEWLAEKFKEILLSPKDKSFDPSIKGFIAKIFRKLKMFIRSVANRPVQDLHELAYRVQRGKYVELRPTQFDANSLRLYKKIAGWNYKQAKEAADTINNMLVTDLLPHVRSQFKTAYEGAVASKDTKEIERLQKLGYDKIATMSLAEIFNLYNESKRTEESGKNASFEIYKFVKDVLVRDANEALEDGDTEGYESSMSIVDKMFDTKGKPQTLLLAAMDEFAKNNNMNLSFKGLSKDATIDEFSELEEERNSKGEIYDINFITNSRETDVIPEVKNFMRYIPMMVDGEGVSNSFGYQKMYDFNEVDKSVLKIAGGKRSTAKIKSALRKDVNKYPYFQDILDRMEADKGFSTAMMVAYNRNKTKYEMLTYDRKFGEYRLIDGSKSGASKSIMQDWIDNSSDNDTSERVYRKNDKLEVVKNDKVASALYNEYITGSIVNGQLVEGFMNVVNSDKEFDSSDYMKLLSILERLGITNINKDVIDSIRKDPKLKTAIFGKFGLEDFLNVIKNNKANPFLASEKDGGGHNFLKELSKAAAMFNKDIFESSYMMVTGEKAYGYTIPAFVNSLVDRMTDPEEVIAFLNEYSKDTLFAKGQSDDVTNTKFNNPLLATISNTVKEWAKRYSIHGDLSKAASQEQLDALQSALEEVISVSIIGGISKSSNDKIPYSKMVDMDLKLTQLSMYFNNANKSKAVFKLIPLSDSSNALSLKVNRMSYNEAIDAIIDMASGEYRRILKVAKQNESLEKNDKISNFHSDRNASTKTGYSIVPMFNGFEGNPADNKEAARELLDKYYAERAAAYAEKLINYKLIAFTSDGKIDVKNSKLDKRQLKHISDAASTVSSKDNKVTPRKYLEIYLKEYLSSFTANVSAFSTLSVGDPAFYTEKLNKDGSVKVNRIVDYFKRAKEIYSPKSNPDVTAEFYSIAEGKMIRARERYNALTLFDEKIIGVSYNAMKEMFDSQVEAGYMTREAADSKLSSYGDGKVNYADAQAFVHPSFYRQTMISFHRWNNTLENAYQKAIAGKADLNDLAILQPVKPFYFNNEYSEKYGTMVPVQNKNSEFVLFPAYIKGKPQLEALYAAMENNDIGITNFESAVKAGINNRVRLSEIANMDSEILKKHIQSQQTIHRGIQVEVPEHHINSSIKYGSQLRAIAISNLDYNAEYDVDGKPMKATELVEHYQNLIEANLKDSYGEVKKEFLNDNGTMNWKSVMRMLHRNALDNNMPERFIDAIKIVNVEDKETGNQIETLSIAVFDPMFSGKTESVFTSKWRNGVTNQKIKGGSFVAASPVGTENGEAPKLVFQSKSYEDKHNKDLEEANKLVTFAKLESEDKNMYDALVKKGYDADMWNSLTDEEKEHAKKCAGTI